MLNLHRDKKIVRREPGRDGKILCDHRQDGNNEVHRQMKEKKEKKSPHTGGQVVYRSDTIVMLVHGCCYGGHGSNCCYLVLLEHISSSKAGRFCTVLRKV